VISVSCDVAMGYSMFIGYFPKSPSSRKTHER
jgi:hypothetical protein